MDIKEAVKKVCEIVGGDYLESLHSCEVERGDSKLRIHPENLLYSAIESHGVMSSITMPTKGLDCRIEGVRSGGEPVKKAAHLDCAGENRYEVYIVENTIQQFGFGMMEGYTYV